ncbi:hypothetical protein J1907_12565 [Lysinibacillus sphaericus]|uniref:hypothetical protein n=1 Tax=Lysinibacillus sphaericus TaxID=1421 RepID=UPI00055AE6F5|nr:hypothetical protein [Lysinibacillus sphaericus]MBG9691272.1 hypothetical protein [Lysinibacillus sphaericus]QTB20669.1 hypothetical protein J1907_12565 [Lysinibacillus sphaericus]
MTIKWNIEQIIFDTLYEADTWADSIANEIYGRIYNGYDTPDYKIAYSLAFRLASIKGCRIYTECSIEERYKVWVIFENE